MTPEQRHINMSHIRSRDTTPEKDIRSALHRAGFRFRIYNKKMPGTPDLVLKKYFAVIFVHGCFWHGHENCSRFRFPRTNQPFWYKKITRNRERDAANMKHYRDECMRVCIVWECAIRGANKKQRIENVTQEIILWLEESAEPFLEIKG